MSNTIKKNSLLPFLIAIYVTALILRPILAVKIFSFGSFKVPAGILVFPLSFICNDIFTEIYGYQVSKNIIRSGLLAQCLSTFVIALSIIIPGAGFWSLQSEYNMILGQNFRLALASLVGCYFGEIVNSIVLSKMKYRNSLQKGNKNTQSTRFVASTVFGELVDSLIYVSMGFYGNVDPLILVSLIFSTWFLKSSYEVIFLPLSISVTNKIKSIEELDTIDLPQVTNYRLV